MTKEEFLNYVKRYFQEGHSNISIHCGKLPKSWVDYLKNKGIEAKPSFMGYWSFKKINNNKK